MNSMIKIAVAGNPNAGKSTLINALAGTRLQVGNWSGVTVEKKEAIFNYRDHIINLVDLPGVYSLSPFSQEEIISSDFLIREKPDVIIDVVDATNLERNLCLTIELMELETPMVIALNIFDEVEKKGYKINTDAISELLCTGVIPTVAKRNIGVDALLEAAISAAVNRSKPKRLIYNEDIENAVSMIETSIKSLPAQGQSDKALPRWIVYKLMEGDEKIRGDLEPIGVSVDIVSDALKHLTDVHKESVRDIIAAARYAQASGLTQEVLTRPEIRREELTGKIDKIVLNKYLGIPIFLFVMWLVFKLTFDISGPFTDWINGSVTEVLKKWALFLILSITGIEWLSLLVSDGIIAGVGFVLSFVPVIFAIMFFITFLEGSGYMARAAFVMDSVMHIIGLHGKSFIPIVLGFGCNVPAIYATRTLENRSDRLLTSLLIPFISCSARLPVYALFVGVFFSENSGSVLWSIYTLGIVLAIIVGLILKNTLFKGKSSFFIMELPSYRVPSWKNLFIHSWEKGKHFVVKAGTYLLAMSIVVWFLFNMPFDAQSKRDSYLGRFSSSFTFIFKPLGFGNWEAVSALITGVMAKEAVVSSMAEIYAPKVNQNKGENTLSVGEDIKKMTLSFFSAFNLSLSNLFSNIGIPSISSKDTEEVVNIKTAIRKTFTPLSAYAFMAFVLLYMPCIVAGIALKQENGTWGWFFFAVLYQFVIAWGIAFLIYQGGRLLNLES
ncbi:MAG: ferrous iron transport protein B [Nitrospirae bacterium]|nr:ferrous iron transport protein B [Nitrospirota bacterium]